MDAFEDFEGFDCSICLERLDETCKALPCQHTFCKSCLKSIVASKQELRCPECRRLVTEDVDDLPGNIMLIRLLEGLKNRRTKKKLETTFVRPGIPFDEPCARAKFSYNAREQGDLTIKRGDLVVLLQKVDEDWYIGELSGKQGYVPANFVEVINPLPAFYDTKRALAKGLHDFEEGVEDDLLHFKQGEIITVTRRVDSNWCEGKIGYRCGIFPVNFVELNRVASLMPSSNGTIAGPQARMTPNVPLGSLYERKPRQKAQLYQPLQRSYSTPRETMESYGRKVRDFGSSTKFAAAGRRRVMGLIHRHSFDALSIDDSHDSRERQGERLLSSFPTNIENIERHHSVESRISQDNQTETTLQQNDDPSGELYVAVYQYRPQKDDELELLCGAHYNVIEKRSDGWFKGFPAQERHVVGHFPGNYVRPVSTTTANGENITDKGMSLIQRRFHKSHSQTLLKPSVNALVVPRPRPFSDISNDLNDKFVLPPPLTPPLVGAKPPKHSLFWKLNIGKKKDRHSVQTLQSEKTSVHQPAADGVIPAGATSSSKIVNTALHSKTKVETRQTPIYSCNVKEKYLVIADYPPIGPMELELKCGDVVYVTKKTENGWFHGSLERNGKVGYVPSSFLEKIVGNLI